jgi:hypothetical protein
LFCSSRHLRCLAILTSNALLVTLLWSSNDFTLTVGVEDELFSSTCFRTTGIARKQGCSRNIDFMKQVLKTFTGPNFRLRSCMEHWNSNRWIVKA